MTRRKRKGGKAADDDEIFEEVEEEEEEEVEDDDDDDEEAAEIGAAPELDATPATTGRRQCFGPGHRLGLQLHITCALVDQTSASRGCSD